MSSDQLGDAVLELSTDDKKLSGGLKDAEKRTKRWGVDIGGIAKTAGLAIAGLGIGAAAAAITFVKAAADEEIGVERLAQAVTNAGVPWDSMQDKIEANIAALERQTAFSDGELRDSLSLLVSMTGSVEEGMKRQALAADLARGTGMDLVTASKLLGKVTDENVTALNRYGISAEKGMDATALLAKVQEKFGGQSEAFAKTASGQWQIFQNTLANLQEDIGGALLPMFKDLAGIATDALAWLKDSGLIEAFSSALKTVLDVLGEIFGVITGTAPDAGAALSGIVGPDVAKGIMHGLAIIRETFKSAFRVASGVLTGFTTGDWGPFQTSIREGAEGIGGRFLGVLDGMKDLARRLLGVIIDNAPAIRDQLLAWAGELINWVVGAVPPMLEKLLGLLSSMLGWLGDHSEEIGETLVAWGLKFGEFILTTAIPAILSNLPGIVLMLGKWVLTEAIPGVLRIFADLGKGILQGIWQGISAGWDWLAGKVRDLVGDLFTIAKRALGISSPSKLFATVGEQIAAGLAVGMDEGAATATRSARRLAAAVALGFAPGQYISTPLRPTVLRAGA